MNKYILSLCFLLGSCVPWQFYKPDPFVPTVDESDLEFVRTGDKEYYYVIDRKRNLCFFHARMYGHSHLTPIPCNKLPEYVDEANAATAKPDKPAPASKPQAEVQPGSGTPTRSPAEADKAPKPLTAQEKNNFKRAYIQHFCSRKTGKAEDLDAILSRHGINRDQYERGKTAFSSDKDLWVALSKEAAETCK